MWEVPLSYATFENKCHLLSCDIDFKIYTEDGNMCKTVCIIIDNGTPQN